MKNYKKITIVFVLILFAVFFINIKSTQAIGIEDIKNQIVIILEKIKGLQSQLTELSKLEKKSITLISPIGGEKFENEKTYDIKWETTGYPSDAKVQIKLIDERYDKNLNSSAAEMNIATALNSGSYSWKIPDTLNNTGLYGSLYKIAIEIGENSDKMSDSSDSYLCIKLAVPPYINLIAPNTPETLQTGKVYRIKWDSLGFEDSKIDIILKNNTSIISTIAERIPNNSYYDWTVPQNYLFGASYKMFINVYDNYGNFVGSASSAQNFSISQETVFQKIKNFFTASANYFSKMRFW